MCRQRVRIGCMGTASATWSHIGDSDWARRVRGLLARERFPVLVRDPGSTGFDFVVPGLGTPRAALLWVQLDDVDEDDHVSQGVRLAEAVERSLGAPLVGYGMHIDRAFRELGRVHHLLGPFTIVVSSRNYCASLEGSARLLASLGSLFVAHVRAPVDQLSLSAPQGFGVVEPTDLYVTSSEWLSLVATRSSSTRGTVPVGTEGAEPLLERLRRCVDRSEYESILRPTPTGAVLLGAESDEVPVEAMAQALLARGRALDAFEILVRAGRHSDDAVIDAAGQEYSRRGLLARAYRVMRVIPAHQRASSGCLMRWFFAAATAANCHADVKAEVHQYLQRNEAPELRALFAAAFPGPEFVEEARRSARQTRSPVTLRIRALAETLSGSADCAGELLAAALRLAERLGDDSQVVAAASEMADLRSRQGRYREAVSWADWAMNWYWRTGCGDELRRMVAASLARFNQLLVGDAASWSTTEPDIDLALAGIPTVEVTISTAAEVAFVYGDLLRSEQLFRGLHDVTTSTTFSQTALDLVRVLRERGAHLEALALGEAAKSLSCRAEGVPRYLGHLAVGVALLDKDPSRASVELEIAVAGLSSASEAPRLAQAVIALATAYARLGHEARIQHCFDKGAHALRELGRTGWALAGGHSPDVEFLRRMHTSDISDVELRFLGGSEVTVQGGRVELGLRQCEVLVALAANPTGVGAERLGLQVYGERAQFSTIKAIVSRLRRQIPISSRPYRVDSLRADFQVLLEHVQQGRARDAVSLYRGPLLPASVAPIVCELRDHIEEAVRSAVLASGDVECMLKLSEVIRDDPELLDAVLERLSERDPRAPIVRALREQIRREWRRG